jgi:ABC-type nickel/cobalt efflux system permease component RcnA
MFYLGILSVIAMSIGMGIVISLAGYLAVLGQKGVFYLLKNKAKN